MEEKNQNAIIEEEKRSQMERRENNNNNNSREREREKDREYRRSSERRESNSRSSEREREKGGDRSERSANDSSRSGRDSNRSERGSKRSRTPSPSRHSSSTTSSTTAERKKKKSLWDQPPTGFEDGQVSINLPISQMPAAAGVANPHQIRQAKRLYIGNLPPEIPEEELAEFFNTAMFHAKVTKDGSQTPVCGAQFNREKNFCFLEFNNMEDATAGMAFDGITLHGFSLKVRRPADYKPIVTDDGVIPGSTQTFLPYIVSTHVQEGPNKIFAGGLPAHLTEEQVKDLFAHFGQLRSFNLVKDVHTGLSKGFAFFDYVNPDDTDKACNELNGTKMGDKTILVQRATLGAKGGVNFSDKSILANATAMNFLNLAMPVAAASALVGVNSNEPSSNPTRILQLMNVASAFELMDEQFYEDTVEDVLNECRHFGIVKSIHMEKPHLPDEEGKLDESHVWGIGRAFVEYSSPQEATRALLALGGRKFGGRIILTGYFDEERYRNKNFVPDRDAEAKYAEDFKEKLQQARQNREEE
eukprot:TRINITY_DN7835_c0_g1_i1.p2 TRINITY_DN7835_c0_g1~~TRINITY_DN7835_c0_g1_i1.p2  ORF type:complete len:530 (-),score=159.85 TRINITY_DN7835_c0_g1_i1:2404-3993(-)